MIIEFSVKNYRSIKELQTLSMLAAPIKSKKSELDTQNIIPVSENFSLLKTAAIYGANGSGKSSIVKAMLNMFVFIRDSFKNDKLGERIIQPFELNDTSIYEPTFFQLIFIVGEVKYRYGFEIFKNEVVSEWLFGTPGKKEVYYFRRSDGKIDINKTKFPEGMGLIDKTSSNNLFLNIAKAFNGKESKKILDYFELKIAINLGVNDFGFRDTTLALLENSNVKNSILSLLNLADSGIEDIENKKLEVEDVPENAPKEIVDEINEGKIRFLLTKRKAYNEAGEKSHYQLFSMQENESEGTKKLFNYSGILIRALTDGRALVIDEFDARLHPLITKKIVELFNSKETNKRGAQLIFVTHDTNLLDKDLLRQDQIYFVEKNSKGESEFYSLAEFKGIRNDASYEKDYIKGKYGAIPFLGDFTKLFD
ncbi:MAG: ATP/GTP-binding protein [Salinivirgaceae bacterium]